MMLYLCNYSYGRTLGLGPEAAFGLGLERAGDRERPRLELGSRSGLA